MTASRLLLLGWPLALTLFFTGCNHQDPTPTKQEPPSNACCGSCPTGEQCFNYHKLGGPVCGCFIPCETNADCPEEDGCHNTHPNSSRAIMDHAPRNACLPGMRDMYKRVTERAAELKAQRQKALRDKDNSK